MKIDNFKFCGRGITNSLFCNLKKIVNKSLYIDMVDPGTPQAPSWRVTPTSAELAIQGKDKTLYCFAVGR